jgi:hypothetical protein
MMKIQEFMEHPPRSLWSFAMPFYFGPEIPLPQSERKILIKFSLIFRCSVITIILLFILIQQSLNVPAVVLYYLGIVPFVYLSLYICWRLYLRALWNKQMTGPRESYFAGLPTCTTCEVQYSQSRSACMYCGRKLTLFSSS